MLPCAMWTVLIAVIIVRLIATIIFSGVIHTSTFLFWKRKRPCTLSLPILFRICFHVSAMAVLLGMKVELCAWKQALSYALSRTAMN